MPLLKYLTDKLPEWSEIERIEHFHYNMPAQFSRIVSSKAVLFVIRGTIIYSDANSKIRLQTDDIIFIYDKFSVKTLSDSVELFLIFGHWGNESGDSGIFTFKNSSISCNIGDKVGYPRTTDFDNHFHDCDEYWFILKGSGIAYSEGVQYYFKEGDCIATQAGDHHDLPQVNEDVTGIYFETTLKGLKRRGHLWSHTHSENIQKESNEYSVKSGF